MNVRVTNNTNKKVYRASRSFAAKSTRTVDVSKTKYSELKACRMLDVRIDGQATPKTGLEELNINELRKIAGQKGIDGAHRMKKEDLIKGLTALAVC